MKSSAPEINAGSMADIAFLLLVFFLVTTTMDSEMGMMRKLPATLPPGTPDPPIIKDRNVFVVLANSNDQLLVEGEFMDISELKAAAKEFIENPMNRITLPEKKLVDVPFFGVKQVSKQVISLQNDNGTSYELYIQVQNELAAAYNELRDELAQNEFGVSYQQLIEKKEKAKVNAIKRIYPQRISEAEPTDVGGE